MAKNWLIKIIQFLISNLLALLVFSLIDVSHLLSIFFRIFNIDLSAHSDRAENILFATLILIFTGFLEYIFSLVSSLIKSILKILSAKNLIKIEFASNALRANKIKFQKGSEGLHIDEVIKVKFKPTFPAIQYKFCKFCKCEIKISFNPKVFEIGLANGYSQDDEVGTYWFDIFDIFVSNNSEVEYPLELQVKPKQSVVGEIIFTASHKKSALLAFIFKYLVKFEVKKINLIVE